MSSAGSLLPPLKQIPIKSRLSVVLIERGEIDVLYGAFVVADVTGVRLYWAGQTGGARSDRLLYQARRGVEQLRGIEGARVRRTYQLLAQRYRVEWKGRDYDPAIWDSSDLANRRWNQEARRFGPSSQTGGRKQRQCRQ